MIDRRLMLGAAAVALISGSACGPRAVRAETMLIHGGPIYTGVAARPTAEAVVVNGDRIAFVGSLAEARAKANDARKLLAAGIDPLAHRNTERMAARAAELHTATFKQCLDGFLISHGDGWRAKHASQWRNSMAVYAKPLDGVAVGDIDVAAVLRIIEPEWKRAPATMDRVRRRIGEVLGWAEARGLRKPGPLPTRWKTISISCCCIRGR